MLTVVMSVDRDGSAASAPFNREELSNWFGNKLVAQGRRTYDSYGPLQGSYNLVIRRDALKTVVPGIKAIAFDAFLELIRRCDVWLIGGVTAFRTLMPYARVAWVDVYDRSNLGFVSPTFSFTGWTIEDTRHMGSMSRYRLSRVPSEDCFR